MMPARSRLNRMGWMALLLGSCLSAWTPAVAQDGTDPLRTGFENPPDDARPRLWWHWMNGNISVAGIEKDLDWMKRIGVGGVQTFDASLATPQIVERPLRYMTPDWRAAFKAATVKAQQLDLELAIASSPGFSETGGPWVSSQDGMKKLVWSETIVVGGQNGPIEIAAPPSGIGPFQTMPIAAQIGRSATPPVPYHADIAILAMPAPIDPGLPPPQASMFDGTPVDAALLDDGLYKDSVRIDTSGPTANGIILRYDAPRTIRAATLFIPGKSDLLDVALQPVLEADVEGQGWVKIADIVIAPVPTTISFSPVTARQFRIRLQPVPPAPLDMGTPAPGVVGAERFSAMVSGTKSAKVAEFRLFSEPRVDRFEAKSGFAVVDDYYALASPQDRAKGIRPADILDITAHLRPDDRLDWVPPKGRWRILRFGYSLIGTTNHPAPSEATGLEVDKMDGGAVRRYMQTYLGNYEDTVGKELIGQRGIRALLNDSIEAGTANWTPAMIDRFRALRGYDPLPWMPALAGIIVGSRARSDAFLFDFRRTIAELTASQHYGTIAQIAHEKGLTLYSEALEGRRIMLGDDMDMRSHADVPMAAMWTFAPEADPKPAYLVDIKGAASVANIYGKKRVAAESLTSALAPWAHAPRDLKSAIDLEFATGVNLPIIHTSVHQPLDQAPGLSFFIFGQYFTRHESWAAMARPWIDYIARSSFLLQQGHARADVAYFYGEEAPLSGLWGKAPLADAPKANGYDFVSPDALTRKFAVRDGQLCSSDVNCYRLLYLGGSSSRMTMGMLRRIAQLAGAGATIAGRRPQANPSQDSTDDAFHRLADRLWSGSKVTRIGQGRILDVGSVEEALTNAHIGADFRFQASSGDADILFAHRATNEEEIYFLTNRKARSETFDAHFRVTGKRPELWQADTGTVQPLSYRIENGETIVPMQLAADEAAFVIFREKAVAPTQSVVRPDFQPVQTLAGPWQVAFQADRGAPDAIEMPTLAPLSTYAIPGIRYFSGIATYRQTFMAPASSSPGSPLLLDLGAVGDLAEVRVNGKMLGTLWHAPYQIDIRPALVPGNNSLDIRVANLWVNRLIGDAQKDAVKIATTSQPTYRADAPLRPSGLIGPVRLLSPQGQD